jgi:hypothetical protein
LVLVPPVSSLAWNYVTLASTFYFWTREENLILVFVLCKIEMKAAPFALHAI